MLSHPSRGKARCRVAFPCHWQRVPWRRCSGGAQNHLTHAFSRKRGQCFCEYTAQRGLATSQRGKERQQEWERGLSSGTPPTTFTVTTIGSEIIARWRLGHSAHPRTEPVRHACYAQTVPGRSHPPVSSCDGCGECRYPPHQISSEDQQGPRLLTCHILQSLQDFFRLPRARCHRPEWTASFTTQGESQRV